MLVLSRKIGEEIVIGEDIRVRVVAIQGNQIRLGFVAPRSVLIRREELLANDRPPARLPVPDAIAFSEPDAPPLPNDRPGNNS
jgi:carbon storage regulator